MELRQKKTGKSEKDFAYCPLSCKFRSCQLLDRTFLVGELGWSGAHVQECLVFYCYFICDVIKTLKIKLRQPRSFSFGSFYTIVK